MRHETRLHPNDSSRAALEQGMRSESFRERASRILLPPAHAIGWRAHSRADDMPRVAGTASAGPGNVVAAPRLAPRSVQLDGKPYVLRPLNPKDAERLREFFYTHTPETIYLRYGFALTAMTPQRAQDLVSVDQNRDLALAVLEVAEGREIIHAIGRYCLDPDGRSAEVALVVRETKRRIGMGAVLLSSLIATARQRGLEFLWGRVRRENLPMLSLLRRFGGKTVRSPDAGPGEVDVRIDLRPRRVEANPPARSSTA